MAHANRLADSASPYLRQHQGDPVDWFPWGDEALAQAKALDRPLFLSIGYSACHWCHVMGHESFADEATAREMNAAVVAVKVDREERPDIDALYMEAVQAATGSGGWPMSVFATPDGRPFFAGTYFPDRPRHGSPAFRQVLAAVSDLWANRRDDVERQADALAGAVSGRLAPPAALIEPSSLTASIPGISPAEVQAAIEAVVGRLDEISDPDLGGFGRAPKFPQPLLVDLLLRAHRRGLGPGDGARALELALDGLDAMARGGIWDHVGGGFSRYSVDREWLVPHFEKMLYDQALLGRVYLHAWQVTAEERFLQVLEELIGYVLSDLRLGSGALASAEDADSEGEEGRFYTWEAAEIDALVGPELAPAVRRYWRVTDEGNFEGRNILALPSLASLRPDENRSIERPEGIERARKRLASARAKRVRPGLDDKVLTEWNAMMCSTLAEAALATGREDWLEAASTVASTLLSRSRLDSGRVLRVPLGAAEAGEGAAEPILGYSADVAWLLSACVRLAEASGEPSFLSVASELAGQLLGLFGDPETGGLFTTGNDAETLFARPRELYDNVTPSATSVAAIALSRLSALTGETGFGDAAARLVGSGATTMAASPTALPELLHAADLVASGTVEVAVSGDRRDLVAAAARRWHPRVVLAWDRTGSPDRVPLLAHRPEGYAYVCQAGRCRLGVSTEQELSEEMDAAFAGPRGAP